MFLNALQSGQQISEEDYYCYLTDVTLINIINNIKEGAEVELGFKAACSTSSQANVA